MALEQDYLYGLTKQVFMLDYIINGLFPCRSDVTRLIRNNKREWRFNDKFEYRMLLAHTNTGGSLNSQVFEKTIGLNRPGSLEYGIYRATYGTVSDGFDVDMMVNLETKSKQAAFENDYSMRMQSLRFILASLFKNFAIHGQYGVVHQLRSNIAAPLIDNSYNPQKNVGFTPVLGYPFTIKVPVNVFASDFKAGKYLIKTKEAAPWGAADVTEIYLVLDNQPGHISLLPCGTTTSAWAGGQFLEVQGNREISMNNTAFQPSNWKAGFFQIGDDSPFGPRSYDQFLGTGVYTTDASPNGGAITGAMEGLADMFPWYTTERADGKSNAGRLGLNRPYRDQSTREVYSTEQAGGWVVQRDDEHIIDAILRGAFLTKIVVPYAEVGIWINPATKQAMGYEEGDNVKVLRDNLMAGPIIYQRGIQSTTYQIGTQVVKEVIEDPNMPTDVVVIGPQKDMAYNCWDNSYMQIDKYVQETWGKALPPNPENLQIPDEFLAKLDINSRVIFGSPSMSDGGMAAFTNGNRIRHPKNMLPIAFQEMGALFTEYPYTYTIVKLLEPVTDFLGD